MTFKFFSRDKKGKWVFRTVGLITFLVIIVGLVFLFSQFNLDILWKKSVPKWQAVFLDNNQVYFGRIVKETKSFVVLRDIYYLQVQQLSQMEEEEEQIQGPRLSLVKLGEEMHGPEDEMKINRDHILFIEQLRTDSQIVQRIAEIVKGR